MKFILMSVFILWGCSQVEVKKKEVSVLDSFYKEKMREMYADYLVEGFKSEVENYVRCTLGKEERKESNKPSEMLSGIHPYPQVTTGVIYLSSECSKPYSKSLKDAILNGLPGGRE